MAVQFCHDWTRQWEMVGATGFECVDFTREKASCWQTSCLNQLKDISANN